MTRGPSETSDFPITEIPSPATTGARTPATVRSDEEILAPLAGQQLGLDGEAVDLTRQVRDRLGHHQP